MPAQRGDPVQAPSGAQLIVTRARDEAGARGESALDRALRTAGVRLHDFALIHIAPPADVAAARRVLDHLEDWQLAIPVSPSAVRAALGLRGRAWPPGCAVGLIGAASGDAFEHALRARGEQPSRLQRICTTRPGADSEALWQALREWRAQWSGVRVLILRGDGGRDWLAETLRGQGADVTVLEAYRRVAPPADAPRLQRLRKLLDTDAPWLLGAGAAVHNLCNLLRAARCEPREVLAGRRALVHHPRVADAARAAGFGRVDVIDLQAESLLRALRRTAP